MDITERLYDLIEAYHLDRCSERFATYRKAVNVLKELAEGFPNGGKVLLIGRSQIDIDQVRMDCDKLVDAKSLIVPVNQGKALDDFDGSLYDVVMIASLSRRLELANALSLRHVCFVDLYDCFQKAGLYLEHDYYQLFGGTYLNVNTYTETDNYGFFDAQRELFYTFKAYQRAEDFGSRSFYLQRVIFICLFIKDISSAKKYLSLYCEQKLNAFAEYEHALSALNQLLEEIRIAMQARRSQSIWMFWLDALEYGDDQNMPFLQSISKEGITFENAYTVTPYTQSTLRTLFFGKKVGDEKAYAIERIDEDSSILYRALKKRGVACWYYGLYWMMFPKENNLSVCWHRQYPHTARFWNAISKMLTEDRSVFLLLHELTGSHWPYLCGDPEELAECFYPDPYHGFASRNQQSRQKKSSLRILDEQLAFYTSLLPANDIKIYMSDHGETPLGRFHTVFKIAGGGVPKMEIPGLFTYLDFYKLVEHLLDSDFSAIPQLERAYVEVQDLPYYNGYAIGQYLKQKSIAHLLGYRGIVTSNMVYIKNDFGKEEYWQTGPASIEELNRELSLCREYVGQSSIDVEHEEKFQYSKYIYRIFRRYYARNRAYENRKRAVIQELFSDEKAVYGIRTGSWAAMHLILELPFELRKRIAYIIDQTDDCICRNLTCKIIRPEEISEFHIDKIIIPVRRKRDYFQKELADLSAEVIELTSYLAEHSVKCTGDFFQPEFTADDLDVDFPFEEVRC